MPTDNAVELPALLPDESEGPVLARHLYHKVREVLLISVANQTKNMLDVRRDVDKALNNPYLEDFRDPLKVDEERRVVDGLLAQYKRLADQFCAYLKRMERDLATETPGQAEARCRDDLLDGAIEALIHSAIVTQETHLALIERTASVLPEQRPINGCPACGLPKGPEADMCAQCEWHNAPEPELEETEEPAKPPKPDWTEEHGRQLALARQHKGWTQAKFGKQIGVNQDRISKWESADQTPSAEYLAVFLRLFGGQSDPVWQDPELGLLAEACLGVPPDTLPPTLEVEAA